MVGLAFYCILTGIVIIIFFTIFGNFINLGSKFSPEILSQYGGFIAGSAGVIFSLATYLLIYETFKTQKKQQFESIFFQLLLNFNSFRTQEIIKDNSNFWNELIIEFGLNDDGRILTEHAVCQIDKKYHEQLFYYCCLLNSILCYLDIDTRNTIYKSFYFNIVNNQISDNEKSALSVLIKYLYKTEFPQIRFYYAKDTCCSIH